MSSGQIAGAVLGGLLLLVVMAGMFFGTDKPQPPPTQGRFISNEEMRQHERLIRLDERSNQALKKLEGK